MRLPKFDKTLHALSGVCLTAAGYVLAAVSRRYGCPAPAWLQALAVCAAGAMVREAYNVWRAGMDWSRWSWSDITATMLGAVPCLIVDAARSDS